MSPLSLVSVCANILVKPMGFFSSAYLRCITVISTKSFSSTTYGPPKKPLNAYMRFAEQQRSVISKQYPEFSVIEVTRKIAKQWRELSSDQKVPFKEAFAVARKQYYMEMELYKNQLTPAQSAALEEQKRQKAAKKQALIKKRELINLGKPKRPRTAINIFMTEHFEEAEGDNMVAKSKALLEIWKKLYSTQKQVYQQLAEDDKFRYKDEMTSWEEHMREIGREDLIRRKSTGVKRQRVSKEESGSSGSDKVKAR